MRKEIEMKEILKQLRAKEAEMKVYEEATFYWMECQQPDMQKSDHYAKLADDAYAEVYNLLQQAAERIVSLTSGQIDKVTAISMMRLRRADVERILGGAA